MDLVTTKVLIAVLFGLIRFFFGILPIKIHRWLRKGSTEGNNINETKRQILEYGIAIVQAFGGGVLFATCFLHMMPEVYYSVEELKKYGVLEDDYPYSQLVLSLGFFTIYFAEEISQWLLSRTSKASFKKFKKSGKLAIITSVNNIIFPQISKVPVGMAFEIEKDPIENTPIEKTDQNVEKNEKYFQDNSSADIIMDNVDKSIQTEEANNLKNLQDMEANLDLDMDVNVEIEQFIEEDVKTQQQMFRCLLMVLALSLHAIFEGLAIGLQRSITNIWYLFIAVSIHSATVLFIIGCEVVLSGASPKGTVIHMSLLSATTPFGVILGLIITLTTNLQTSAKSFAIVLLEGLSAGTILYITFFETLSREKERKSCRALRAIFIGAGFALMAILQSLKLGM